MPEYSTQSDAGPLGDFLRSRRNCTSAHQLEHRRDDPMAIFVPPDLRPSNISAVACS